VGNVSKVIAEKNDPQADFILVDDALIPELVENKAIDKLDFSRISNTAGYFGSIQKQIKQYENYYLPVVTQSVGIGYRQDLLKKAGLPVPTRWSDLWNPVYKGRVVLVAWNYNFAWSFIEATAAVRCGDPKNLECAFQEVKKLREMGQLALTVDSLVALEKAFADGEAWLGLCNNNRCFTAQDKGVDVQFFVPQDYPLTTTSGVAAVRRPNWDALMTLFNMCADARGQAKLLEYVTQGPVHKDARQYLPSKMLTRVPTTEAQWATLITPNWDHMRKFRPTFMERFTREVAR
jgi:spermidine/putrescine-binding protein